jgi:hypothetical protein
MDSNEASALMLQALVWTLQDDRRAQRLLALTGLDADTLRLHIHQPSTQRAVIDFLEGHEADLIACAAALEVSPPKLLAAREALK